MINLKFNYLCPFCSNKLSIISLNIKYKCENCKGISFKYKGIDLFSISYYNKYVYSYFAVLFDKKQIYHYDRGLKCTLLSNNITDFNSTQELKDMLNILAVFK